MIVVMKLGNTKLYIGVRDNGDMDDCEIVFFMRQVIPSSELAMTMPAKTATCPNHLTGMGTRGSWMVSA